LGVWHAIIAIVASRAFPAASGATTYYAAVNGSNTTGCTTPATACDLRDAIQTAPQANGDEVVVLPGTYDVGSSGLNVSTAISLHGQAGQPMPEIDGDTSNGDNALMTLSGGTGTTVSDLKFVETGTTPGPASGIVDASGGAELDQLIVDTEGGLSAVGVNLTTR
jgi:hypothetical protein